jgi:hypothetical protein
LNKTKLFSSKVPHTHTHTHTHIYFFLFSLPKQKCGQDTSQKNPQQQQCQSLPEETNQSNKTKLVACHTTMPGGSGWEELQDEERILKNTFSLS